MTDHIFYDLENDGENATQIMTDTQVTVKSITWTAESAGHILHRDNLFSSPDLFNSLHTKIINCCGTARQIINVSRAVTIRH
jgi:hypothetical protein